MLTPPVKKLSFVCIWFSFAFALFLLNRHKKRRTFDSIPNFGFWQGAVLGMLPFNFNSISNTSGKCLNFELVYLYL